MIDACFFMECEAEGIVRLRLNGALVLGKVIFWR